MNREQINAKLRAASALYEKVARVLLFPVAIVFTLLVIILAWPVFWCDTHPSRDELDTAKNAIIGSLMLVAWYAFLFAVYIVISGK